MKTLVIFICAFFTIQTTEAQTTYTPTAGTWKYINGNTSIELYLKTGTIDVGTEHYNVFLGFHNYILNGNLVENTLGSSATNFSDNQYSFIIYEFTSTDTKGIGLMKDITLNTKRKVLFQKTSSNTMSVELFYREGVVKNTPYEFTMPTNFILTKQ